MLNEEDDCDCNLLSFVKYVNLSDTYDSIMKFQYYVSEYREKGMKY